MGVVILVLFLDLWKFPELENFVFKKPVLFLTGDREKAWSISDKDIRKIRYYFPDSHFVKVRLTYFLPREKWDNGLFITQVPKDL